MDLEKIKNARTKYIGKNIIYFKEIDSTQKYSKEMVNNNLKNGTIVITDNQTKGIGTNGRNWYSNIGKNITMTITVYPNVDVNKLNNLTIDVARAMQKTIQDLYNINLNIKKPNDLIINNKKIAGFLVETGLIKQKVNYILIGVVFNVNEVDFCAEIKDIATSLKEEFKKDFSREDIIVNFKEDLENVINNLVN